RGSVADTVGQLRPGDEVLEWNGKCLQNITHDEVYNIINASKNDSKVELIVSRPMNVPGGDDFLNIQRILPNAAHVAAGQGVAMDGAYPLRAGYGSVRDVSAGPPFGGHIPHSQSLVAAPLRQFDSPVSTLQRDAARRAASPVVYHRSPAPLSAYSMDPLPVGLPHGGMQMSKGQIFGRIEISLLYMPPERELIVTVHRAYDLPPRPDGSLRNPYAKVFLLPDRSEKSRRQSAVLAETLAPIWNESFYYYGLTEPMLMSRVLEVTLWDYDQYEANSFLGETLIDLSTSVLDNQPFSYTLVDMDEENPIRM
ncbi:rab-3-interacting molecule unc-10, partial [Aphelenchoides avenae]